MNGESRVFLSFAKEDLDVVKWIAEHLKDEGFKVFFADASLPPGDRLSWVFDRIAEAEFLVAAISRNSVNSRWVLKEISVAVARQMSGHPTTIVPLRLDDADLPTVLADVVSLDFRDPQEGIKELLAVLRGQQQTKQTLLTEFRDYLAGLPIVAEDQAKCIYHCLWKKEGSGSDLRVELRDEAQCRELLKERISEDLLLQLDLDYLCGRSSSGHPAWWGWESPGGFPPGVLPINHVEDVTAWLRFARPAHVALAAKLYPIASSGCYITDREINWIRSYMRNSGLDARMSWSTENLLQEARSLGLLGDQRPLFDSWSVDQGPMLFLIGGHAWAFLKWRDSDEGA